MLFFYLFSEVFLGGVVFLVFVCLFFYVFFLPHPVPTVLRGDGFVRAAFLAYYFFARFSLFLSLSILLFLRHLEAILSIIDVSLLWRNLFLFETKQRREMEE